MKTATLLLATMSLLPLADDAFAADKASQQKPNIVLILAYNDFLTQFASAEGIGGTIARVEQADGNSGGRLLLLSKPRHNDRDTPRGRK